MQKWDNISKQVRHSKKYILKKFLSDLNERKKFALLMLKIFEDWHHITVKNEFKSVDNSRSTLNH
jgi:hypothetical protein